MNKIFWFKLIYHKGEVEGSQGFDGKEEHYFNAE